MTDRSPVPRRSKVASLARSYPFVVFATLAIAVSWIAWIPLLVAASSPTSLLMIPGAFGPALAAAAVIWLVVLALLAWYGRDTLSTGSAVTRSRSAPLATESPGVSAR